MLQPISHRGEHVCSRHLRLKSVSAASETPSQCTLYCRRRDRLADRDNDVYVEKAEFSPTTRCTRVRLLLIAS